MLLHAPTKGNTAGSYPCWAVRCSPGRTALQRWLTKAYTFSVTGERGKPGLIDTSATHQAACAEA